MSAPTLRGSESKSTLVGMFPPAVWIPNLKAREKKAAIREILQHLADVGLLKEDAAKKAEKAIQKREAQGSTAIGKGLAIPHAKDCSFLREPVGAFARIRDGLSFDAVDGGLVHVVFLLISPVEFASQHIDVLRRIAKLHSDEKTLKFLAQSESLANLEEILKEVDDTFR